MYGALSFISVIFAVLHGLGKPFRMSYFFDISHVVASFCSAVIHDPQHFTYHRQAGVSSHHMLCKIVGLNYRYRLPYISCFCLQNVKFVIFTIFTLMQSAMQLK